MFFKGRAWKFGSNIDTDVIIPARYLTTHDPALLAPHCLEGIDPDFARKCQPGDILVAEWNFGCGSSREHAPIAIRGVGVACVVAKSFARIFYRNAFNTGLPLLEVPETVVDHIQSGDLLEIDLESNQLTVSPSGARYSVPAIPAFMRELLDAGGLIPFVRKRLRQQGRYAGT